MSEYVNSLMALVRAKNPSEPEFHQAVQEVADSLELVLERHPEYRSRKDPRADGRTGPCDHVSRPLDRRSGGIPHQPWIPDPDEQRHRALQGWAPVSPLGESRHPEVPGLRAGIQEQPDDAAHGRRQGGIGFRPERKERSGGHAVLSEFHDRALPACRSGHRRPGRGYRGRGARDRVSVRAVQAADQGIFGRPHRQRAQLGGVPGPPGGHRLRGRLFCPGDAEDQELLHGRKAGGDLGLRQRRLGRRDEGHGARREGRHAFGPGRFRVRRERDQRREDRVHARDARQREGQREGLCRQVQGPLLSRQASLGREGGRRAPLRDPERAQRGGRARAVEERLPVRLRGGQYAHHARRREGCSWTRRSSTLPARPPTPAGLRPRGWR